MRGSFPASGEDTIIATMREPPAIPASGAFPRTRYSIVEAVASEDAAVRRQAFDVLAEAYWKPAYKYLRLRWRFDDEEARDAVQEFFSRAFERSYFDRYQPGVALFRTFLRTCLDRFAANQRRDERRLKRGGGVAVLPFDFAGAEGELARREPLEPLDPEDYFHREWVREFLSTVVAALRRLCEQQGKTLQFALFERYDLDADLDAGAARPTYAQLAAETGLPVTQVTNYLAWARREMRRLALERLRELCANEDEVRAEARALFGVEPPATPPGRPGA